MFDLSDNFENVAVIKPWRAAPDKKTSATKSYEMVPGRNIFVMGLTGAATRAWGIPLDGETTARKVVEGIMHFGLQDKPFELMASDLIYLFDEIESLPRLDEMEVLLIENNLGEEAEEYTEKESDVPEGVKRKAGALTPV